MAEAIPFAGGEVFNPADFVRVTNCDPDSWVHMVGGQLQSCKKHSRARQAIVGRWGGKDYVFPFEKPVNVHLNVAKHVFGLGMDDKTTALARLGWAATSDALPDAYDRLTKIKFEDLPELMEVNRFKIAGVAGVTEGDGTKGVPGATAPPKDPSTAPQLPPPQAPAADESF
jgi:hypothetical protein